MIREMNTTEPIVYVVDDDPQACRAVAELVHSFGHQVRSFESPDAFLKSVDPDRPGCVVLDVRLPGLDGLEVHRQLVQQRIPLPAILLTTYANTGMTVRSLRDGAVSVLDKPYRDDELWNCVHEAIARSQLEHRRNAYQRSLEDRLKKLSPQDRSVLKLMLAGVKNRTIAKRLEVSLRTVENRRRRVFDVMQADSVAQLTRMIVEYEHKLLPAEELQDAWMSLPFDRVAV
ncbi:MAG: response regulator [Planctomycetota bacterium]